MAVLITIAQIFVGAVVGAIALGLAGFAAGFFGPMIFMPEANQGPLIGFATGPLGALAGAVIGGVIGWRMRLRNLSH
jgi:hypothetical protein